MGARAHLQNSSWVRMEMQQRCGSGLSLRTSSATERPATPPPTITTCTPSMDTLTSLSPSVLQPTSVYVCIRVHTPMYVSVEGMNSFQELESPQQKPKASRQRVLHAQGIGTTILPDRHQTPCHMCTAREGSMFVDTLEKRAQRAWGQHSCTAQRGRRERGPHMGGVIVGCVCGASAAA